MADNDDWKGANFKQEADFTKEATELLERVNATQLPVLLRSSNKTVDNYVEELLVVEKMARLGGDVASTQKLAVEALRLYRVQPDMEKMLKTLEVLMKKRAQTKQVQSAMIAECSVVLEDESLPRESRKEVLTHLAHVTESKIHVELEHARFTIQLARLEEADGNKRPASDMLRSLQIETITNMPRLEKLDALNHQIRLCLELRDYDHIPLVSRKINHRALARAESRDEKLVYFTLMREYYTHRKSYFSVARCWYETFRTLKDTDDKKLASLSNMVVFYLISEHSPPKDLEDLAECSAFSPHTKYADRTTALREIETQLRSDLEDLPQLHNLLHCFNTVELVREAVKKDVTELCAHHPMLAEFPERQEMFQNRCSEHDLIVVSHFYSRIRLSRLALLVGLTEDHTERFVMSMVTAKSLYAKMDRVDGVVNFEAKKNATEMMTEWNEAVERSVGLIDKASHLIVKERMLHNVNGATGASTKIAASPVA